MPLVFKHFWIAFVLVTVLNGVIWWWRGRAVREDNPELTSSYRALVRGFMLWGNIPWIVMGAGILIGRVPSVFHYFDPTGNNPFVLAWFGSVFLVWIAGTYWLFARDGAEQMIRHPGLLSPQFDSPFMIKAIWLVSIVGGIFGIGMMVSGIFEIPNL